MLGRRPSRAETAVDVAFLTGLWDARGTVIQPVVAGRPALESPTHPSNLPSVDLGWRAVAPFKPSIGSARSMTPLEAAPKRADGPGVGMSGSARCSRLSRCSRSP